MKDTTLQLAHRRPSRRRHGDPAAPTYGDLNLARTCDR
jgi:hypothetical protein